MNFVPPPKILDPAVHGMGALRERFLTVSGGIEHTKPMILSVIHLISHVRTLSFRICRPRFHQVRGPSPEVYPRNLAVLYVPETIPERQNPYGRHTSLSSSPNSIAKYKGEQAETIQDKVSLLFENAPLGRLKGQVMCILS